MRWHSCEQEGNFPKLCFVYTKGNFKQIKLFHIFNIVFLSSKNLPWLFMLPQRLLAKSVLYQKRNIINVLWRQPALWYNPIIYL